jgi:hypothetical protein
VKVFLLQLKAFAFAPVLGPFIYFVLSAGRISYGFVFLSAQARRVQVSLPPAAGSVLASVPGRRIHSPFDSSAPSSRPKPGL